MLRLQIVLVAAFDLDLGRGPFDGSLDGAGHLELCRVVGRLLEGGGDVTLADGVEIQERDEQVLAMLPLVAWHYGTIGQKPLDEQAASGDFDQVQFFFRERRRGAEQRGVAVSAATAISRRSSRSRALVLPLSILMTASQRRYCRTPRVEVGVGVAAEALVVNHRADDARLQLVGFLLFFVLHQQIAPDSSNTSICEVSPGTAAGKGKLLGRHAQGRLYEE